jgi:hypothetical protein
MARTTPRSSGSVPTGQSFRRLRTACDSVDPKRSHAHSDARQRHPWRPPRHLSPRAGIGATWLCRLKRRTSQRPFAALALPPCQKFRQPKTAPASHGQTPHHDPDIGRAPGPMRGEHDRSATPSSGENGCHARAGNEAGGPVRGGDLPVRAGARSARSKIEFVHSSSVLTQRKNEGREGPRSVAKLKFDIGAQNSSVDGGSSSA